MSRRCSDPFAGGGAIPLEALRLGCEAHAIDINPVAHLIELCTLVYPQKYGQPDSRPVPDYIKRLVAHNRAKKKAKGKDRPLLDAHESHESPVAAAVDEIIPDVEITEAEYRKNPLIADVKYWGHWVLDNVSARLNIYIRMTKAAPCRPPIFGHVQCYAQIHNAEPMFRSFNNAGLRRNQGGRWLLISDSARQARRSSSFLRIATLPLMRLMAR